MNDLRQEHVVLETERYRIEGMLTLPSEGYRSRVSDFVNQRDRDFFTLSDAKISVLEHPGDVRELPFVMVGRRHITLLSPAEPGREL